MRASHCLSGDPFWGRLLAVAALSLTALLPATALSEEADNQKEGDSEWVRLLSDDTGGALALQTAIGRYEGRPPGASSDVVVDLVGAVHVGDRKYYRQLDRRFPQYDALLYELVAPPGTKVKRGQRLENDNPLGALQNGMKSVLGLEHQLEQIDYTRPNFVHADMSPKQLFQSMEERDEGFLKMYFRMVGQSIALQSRQMAEGESVEIDMMKAMLSDNPSRELKIVMAQQFNDLEGVISGLGGDQGSTLIEERNRIALEGLDREIRSGKKKLAVFYGAGHLMDMDERLRRDFNLRQTGKEWVTAWDLSDD